MTTKKKPRKSTMRYLSRTPAATYQPPKGWFLAHNHVQPVELVNVNGFRAFVVHGSLIGNYKECKCGWAGGLKHYKGKSQKA